MVRQYRVIRELESGKKLGQLSRENNIHPNMISRWKLEYDKDSNHGEKICPNLAKTLEITDVFSRRCIGWDLSRNIDTQLTLNALLKAFLKILPQTKTKKSSN